MNIKFFDGSMGTMLQSMGLGAGELPELLNLTDSEKVLAVHRAYAQAGSEYITTNTFGANRLKYPEGGEFALEEVVRSAVNIAKSAQKACGREDSFCRRCGARVAATTHYAELKLYAMRTEGVTNASCEFDVQTLQPTYRLLIGVPGKSNAFAITQRLGMDTAIVDRARELVSREGNAFEQVVGRLEEDRRKMEDELEALRASAAQAKANAEASQRLKDEAEAQAKKEIDRARQEAAQIVQKTRQRADALVGELEELRRQKNKQLSAEQKARLRSGLKELESSSDPVHQRRDDNYVLPRPLVVGDEVLLYDIDKEATVLELPKDGTVLVQAGIIKTRVPLSNLRLLDEKKAEWQVFSEKVNAIVTGTAGAMA